MEHTLDVRATPAEVLDLAVRVIGHHAGTVAECNEVVARGTFGKSGFLGKQDSAELRVGTVSLDHETTRVQVTWADGECANAAQTLLDGLAPHVIESPVSESHGASSVTPTKSEPSTTSMPTPESYCLQCGATFPSADASFCAQCGTRVSQPANSSTSNEMHFHDDDKTVVAEDEAELVAIDEEQPDSAIVEISQEETPCWEIATVVDEPEPPVAEARLVVDGHPDVKFALLSGEEFLVGRDNRVASWIPDDPRISRRHFRISVHEYGFSIEDLASSNGTYVNGAFVREAQPLADGDVIEVGHLRAVFRMDNLPLTE